jgi:hypothetical protein
MEIGCNPQEEKVAKACDDMFLQELFNMKVDFFGPSKAKSITSVDALKPMYKNLLREGSAMKDGGNYPNSLRMKVDGWAKYIQNVNVVEKVKPDGEKLKVVKDCAWKDRLVDDNDPPGERDTHFLLFLGNNPETGKPRYSDKVVVQDSQGRPIVKDTDKSGKTSYVMRYVGPQDAVSGSSVTVVWQLSKLYLTETTGPTSVAKDVYIKPMAKKVVAHRAMDDVEIDEDANVEESLDALKKMQPEEKEPIEEKPEEDKHEEEKHDDASPQSGKKRKLESKKAKRVEVQEDF